METYLLNILILSKKVFHMRYRNNICRNANIFMELATNFSTKKVKHLEFSSKHKKNKLQQSHSDIDLCDTEYYFENGFRKVYPYYYEYTTFCKGRWIGKELLKVYCNEFSMYPKEVYKRRILAGKIKINKQIASSDYVLKNRDLITSKVHRHELAVLDVEIKVVYENEDILVIDKPVSIPVHPCGLYRWNTLTFILAKEYNYKNLNPVHRLDRLTSGILIFSKTSKKANEICEQMLSSSIRKEYICMVEGNFPDGMTNCDKPLKQFYNNIGISMVHPEGKPSSTEFVKLNYNGENSIILCRPLTGRTHQIRVHLQFLGHPIINDPLYNSYIFGPERGKNGNIGKTIAQLSQDLILEHSTRWWLEEDKETKMKFIKNTCDTLKIDIKNYLNFYEDVSLDSHSVSHRSTKDPQKFTFDENCLFCKHSYRNPLQTHLSMFLHAYKYKGEHWEFETKMPQWVSGRI